MSSKDNLNEIIKKYYQKYYQDFKDEKLKQNIIKNKNIKNNNLDLKFILKENPFFFTF